MKTFSQLSEELEQYMPVEEAVKKPDPEYHLKQSDWLKKQRLQLSALAN